MAKDDDGLSDLDKLAPPGVDPPEDLDDQDNEPDNPDDFEADADEDRAGDDEPDAIAASPPADKVADKAPSRGESRIQKLRAREAATRRQLADANRRVDELLRMQRQQPAMAPPQPTETPAQREARRSQMSPEEKIREDMRERDDRVDRMLSQVAYGNADQTDKMLYEAKAAANPRMKRWAAHVEKVRQELAQKGQFVDRTTIYYHEIGRAMDEQASSPKQREAAARRVRAQTTRPGSARSDTAASRQRTGRTPEERLADVPL